MHLRQIAHFPLSNHKTHNLHLRPTPPHKTTFSIPTNLLLPYNFHTYLPLYSRTRSLPHRIQTQSINTTHTIIPSYISQHT